MDEHRFDVTLDLRQGYEFAADVGPPGVPDLVLDEPPPLGAGHGPNATRLLAAAIGHCLGASYLFCMRKARIEVERLKVHVSGSLVRNERGRMRIAGIRVRLEPRFASAAHERVGRCLELFEDFCIVTQSVRQGIDVAVQVAPAPVGVAS
jgi:organic hydroperoxide reductase OsmC/OhrA